jgi:hypothetical protein
MIPTISLAPPRATDHAMPTGLLAGLVSATLLLWRGRADARRAVAPINAISHWFWPDEAMRRDDPSLKHTGTGLAVHAASSILWATAYGWLRARRHKPDALNAALDAATVTAVAAVVDLAVVPKRLTPGFERRLSKPSLGVVYAGFAIGLAVGGALALRRH